MKHKIGFIGAGTMGSGMITNLVKKGFNVKFYNRTVKKIEGAYYSNLEDLEADVFFICVSNDQAVKELFSKIKFKPGNIFVDTGTTSLELTQKIKVECGKKKVGFLDAPITGSKLGSESGNLLFMVGGKKEVFDKLHEEFDAMGKKAVYCGETPNGQKIKHVLNLTQSNILQSYLEGIVFSLKQGLELDVILDVMQNSAANNGVGSFKLPYIRKRHFNPHFLLNLMHKDLKLAEEEIKELKLNLPLSKETIKIFDEAMKDKLGNEDFSAIVKLLEEKNKIKVR